MSIKNTHDSLFTPLSAVKDTLEARNWKKIVTIDAMLKFSYAWSNIFKYCKMWNWYTHTRWRGKILCLDYRCSFTHAHPPLWVYYFDTLLRLVTRDIFWGFSCMQLQTWAPSEDFIKRVRNLMHEIIFESVINPLSLFKKKNLKNLLMCFHVKAKEIFCKKSN